MTSLDEEPEKRPFEKIEIESIIADAINMFINRVIDERVVVTRDFLLGEDYERIRNAAIDNTVRIWWR